ncbi:hypothetical protein [Pseudomonas sp. SLFW]|uniref:hypothetical protein n=1 Tax=Pseudomonas sp. SLFW TaxID=2683259 RepID=UPI0014127698|nr:hypothetical protein [Pseudomonas sp. SLFW]NBB12526.1 hypothetical protein [Pseudomonas sp. SLFW]
MPLKRFLPQMTCLAALMAPLAHAADALHVFTGTLGKSPIVVELDLTKPDDISGRYFYEKYHKDLALSGKQTGQDLTLTEGLSYDDNPDLPTLRLHKSSDAGWAGEWSSSKGKSYKVQLSEKKVAAPDATAEPGWQGIYRDSPYDYLRLSQLKLKADKKETFMGHDLQWWVEPESGITLFEITSGYAPEQAEKINRQLRSRLWNEVVSYHQCMLGGSRTEGEFDQSVTPELMTSGIVSLNISTSYDCGGAHPDFGDSPLNLDATTGKELTLEDVLWVGKGKPFHYERDEAGGVSFDTYSDYRSKAFAPWLVSQLKAAHPDDMKAPETDDDCDYTDESVWDFPSWYFTEEGIYVGPYFARVMRACEGPEWSVVPYAAIKAHPGGVKVVLPE